MEFPHHDNLIEIPTLFISLFLVILTTLFQYLLVFFNFTLNLPHLILLVSLTLLALILLMTWTYYEEK